MSTKQRVWAGETPYGNDLAQFRDNNLLDDVWELRPTAYRAAMNSDVVKGLYEAAKEKHDHEHFRLCYQYPGQPQGCKLVQALTAYEKGLTAGVPSPLACGRVLLS